MCALQVDQDSDGNTVLACPFVEPGCLYPEEVSACIVQQLLEDAAQHTNVPSITKAVITVPAYFNDEQRDATVAAGEPNRKPLACV
jgi:molecular chaperone DnaK